MANINTILIKRRTSGSAGAPAALSGGELAFNEVDSTLYYGSASGVIAIGGSGAYVNRTTNQTIAGNKTFSGSTTLSSTTFSFDSTLDFGGNVLTNIGAPVNDTDASTKLYVDTVASNASTGTESLSTEVYNTFVKLTDDRAVNLTGGLTVNTVDVTSNATVGGNLTVTGDLEVLGAVTSLETTTTVTSAFSINNAGSQTAFTATQTGAQNVAEFYDDANIALAIVDGGNVGIGTLNPNEALTVVGNISATGNVNAVNGDFTGTLDVDGVTTLGSTLTVTGASTLNSTLDVIGGATFASTVSAQGAVEFDSTLTVDGVTTLNNNLVVLGTTSLDNGTITTDGAGTITGTLGVSQLIDFIIDGGTF